MIQILLCYTCNLKHMVLARQGRLLKYWCGKACCCMGRRRVMEYIGGKLKSFYTCSYLDRFKNSYSTLYLDCTHETILYHNTNLMIQILLCLPAFMIQILLCVLALSADLESHRFFLLFLMENMIFVPRNPFLKLIARRYLENNSHFSQFMKENQKRFLPHITTVHTTDINKFC
jgi:hypothetical protein